MTGGGKNQAHKTRCGAGRVCFHRGQLIILLSRYLISRHLRLAASGRIWCSSVSYNFPISGVMLTLKGFQLTSEEFKSSGDGSDVIGVIVVSLNIWRILCSVCSLGRS